MTNPNDSVGTNGAYGGRTSVNALNDVLASFTGRGVLSGWGVTASSGMTVNVGGSAGVRDVAIAEDNAGNRTTVDNRSSSPISVTLSAASASSTRIDCIVAYVNNPATVLVKTIDNPGTCGIIAVNGTTSAPNDAAIRSAITADGGTGSTAYYVVLATVTIAAGTTDLTDANISKGATASPNVDLATITKTESLEVGYGAAATFARFGNIVVVNSWTRFQSAPGSGWKTLTETLPEYLRPTMQIYVEIDVSADHTRTLTYRFDPDGTIALNIRSGSAPTDTNFNISGSWITESAFPTS